MIFDRFGSVYSPQTLLLLCFIFKNRQFRNTRLIHDCIAHIQFHQDIHCFNLKKKNDQSFLECMRLNNRKNGLYGDEIKMHLKYCSVSDND